MDMNNFGIFGGLFDPPHIGHLVIAQWVREEFDLKKIIFVPAFNPPHKKRYSSYDDRYEMTRLAIRNNKDFLLSDIERMVKGKTYTVEVIRALKQRNSKLLHSQIYLKKIRSVGACPQLYLIIGADQWQEIKTWKNPEELLKECKVIVVPRPNYKIKKASSLAKKILISRAPLIDISSTLIRKMVKKGMSINYFVPEPIFRFVKRHNLYC